MYSFFFALAAAFAFALNVRPIGFAMVAVAAAFAAGEAWRKTNSKDLA